MTPPDPDRRQFLQAAAATTAALALSSPVHAADEELPYGIVDVLDSDPATGMSAAVIVGDVPLVHTMQCGWGNRSANARFAPELYDAGTISADLQAAIAEVDTCLKLGLSGLDRVVKFNFYVSHPKAVAIICDWLQVTYTTRYRPAVSFVVSRPADPRGDSFVKVDCVAVSSELVAPGEVVRFQHGAVLPPTHKLYVSGDAVPGLILVSTVATLGSLEQNLKFCGLDWSHVVQLKVFLQPMNVALAVYGEIQTYFIGRTAPLVSIVEWQSSEKVPLEIELIAAVPPELGNQSGDTVEYINPPQKPGNAVFSRIARVRSERTIYTSGLYGEPSDPDGQIRDIFDRLKKLVERGGGDLHHLVKATYYVSDDVTSKKLGEIRPEYYDPKRPPAASKAKVVDVGREGKTVTLDMIAVPKPSQNAND